MLNIDLFFSRQLFWSNFLTPPPANLRKSNQKKNLKKFRVWKVIAYAKSCWLARFEHNYFFLNPIFMILMLLDSWEVELHFLYCVYGRVAEHEYNITFLKVILKLSIIYKNEYNIRGWCNKSGKNGQLCKIAIFYVLLEKHPFLPF